MFVGDGCHLSCSTACHQNAFPIWFRPNDTCFCLWSLNGIWNPQLQDLSCRNLTFGQLFVAVAVKYFHIGELIGISEVQVIPELEAILLVFIASFFFCSPLLILRRLLLQYFYVFILKIPICNSGGFRPIRNSKPPLASTLKVIQDESFKGSTESVYFMPGLAPHCLVDLISSIICSIKYGGFYFEEYS